jgi:hypothetical protein
VIATKLAETTSDAGALVEDLDEPRIDPSHFVAQLVCLSQRRLRHHNKLNAAASGCHIAYALRVNGATRDTLEQLRKKYGEMLSMRLAHDSGVESEARARERMAELASQFPGALREIDDLDLGVIRDRIGRLDAALRGDAPVERWMEAVGLFHTLARGALRAKRWLAGRKVVDLATVLEYERDIGGEACGAPASGATAAEALAAAALTWSSELARIAAPPRGRIMDLVFDRIARTLGTTEPEARYLVFGTSRRSRGARQVEVGSD